MTPVRLDPAALRSWVKRSTTEPLRSQPKHMLWVLKRTVSEKRFFWTPKIYVKTDGQENIHIFTLKYLLISTYGLFCCFFREDVHSGREVTLEDIKFEQACVLYNIGSLHSVLGAMDTRQSADVSNLRFFHLFQQIGLCHPYQLDACIFHLRVVGGIFLCPTMTIAGALNVIPDHT